jgi:hypothetical protein
LLYGHVIKTARSEQTMLNTLWNFADVMTARYWRALLLRFPSRYYTGHWNCNTCESLHSPRTVPVAREFYVLVTPWSAIDWPLSFILEISSDARKLI